MLLDFWLIGICSANLNYQKRKFDDANIGTFDSYSELLHQNTNSDKNSSQKISNLYETETAIYTTSVPNVSAKLIMYICYAAGILFLSFTIFLFIYAIFKCKQHNYQEI